MKNFKKIISIILCLSIISGAVAVSAFAADTESADGDFVSEAEYPIIFVTGIGQSYSYLYETEEDAQADIALLLRRQIQV